MTIDEAKNIIEKFHQSIKDLRPNAIVQDSKNLPYTSARIKYAHFVYGEHFVNNGFYNKTETKEEMLKSVEKVCQELMESYGLIDSLFSEDAEEINVQYKEFIKGLNNGIITGFRMPNPYGETESVYEFRNFFSECWFIKHRTNIFNNNPLGSFIYDAVLNKSIKENDINTLKETANTDITRVVYYPGKER